MPEEKCIINPERDCIGKEYALKLESRIKNLEEWREDSKDFHSKFYDWQREQIARDAKLDEQLKTINSNIAKVLTWQETEQSKPGKRWETIIAAIIAAAVGFLLAQIGIV